MAKNTNNSSEEAEKAKQKKLANLKPFKKGQSGNPAGKKKGCKNMSTRAKEMLAAVAEDNEYATPLVKALLNVLDEDRHAKPSEVIKAVEVFRDTIEGKPTQQVDNISSDGSMASKPQRIELVAPDDDSENSPTA